MSKTTKKMLKMPQTIASLAALIGMAVILGISAPNISTILLIALIIVFLGLSTIVLYGQFLLAKEIEKQNRPKSKQLDSILRNMTEGVIIYTPDFEITHINPAAENMLNVKARKVKGKTISPDSLKSPDTKSLTQIIFPTLAPVVNRISDEGWPQKIQINLEDPEKKLTTIVDRIKDDSGDVRAFVKIIKDRTREEKVLESKTEFITTSAHQLRTPLSGISWALETIVDSSEDEEITDIAQQGHDLAAKATKIINDLLTVTELEEGGFNLKLETRSIKETIEKEIKESRGIANQYGVDLSFDEPQKDYQVKIDPSQVSIVLSILIDNAITYNTENGSVTLSYNRSNGDPFIRVQVSDTGMGIPEDEQKDLFKKFHRGEKASKTEPNGSGLGLYIAKQIIESHGGQIWVDSTPGRGSTFYLTLPLAN